MSYLSGKSYLSPLHKAALSIFLELQAIPVYWSFSEANFNARFGSCADIVSYLCKFKTKWHQILDASLSNNPKVACRKKW